MKSQSLQLTVNTHPQQTSHLISKV